MVEGVPGSKYTIQNYDHSGKRVEYDPNKHGKDVFVEEDEKGNKFVEESDNKIQLNEFQDALMDYYQDKYGKICDDNSVFANINNPKAMNFIQQALTVRIDNDIENDEEFQALLKAKAEDLHNILEKGEKPDIAL